MLAFFLKNPTKIKDKKGKKRKRVNYKAKGTNKLKDRGMEKVRRSKIELYHNCR